MAIGSSPSSSRWGPWSLAGPTAGHEDRTVWFMNHVAAPVVRALLRSPLHGLLGGSVLLVTYRGCRSGRAFTLPVQYVRDEEAFVVTVGAPGAKQWWRNFTEPRPAELLVRRRPVAVIGEVETDRDGATRVVFTPDAAPR